MGEQIKADRSRECAACGGTGGSYPYNHDSRGVFWGGSDCHVCLGSGRIVDDSTSQRDANADAETLLLVSAAGDNQGLSDTRGHENLRVYDDVKAARSHASEWNIQKSVRAAFRAVPGLRDSNQEVK